MIRKLREWLPSVKTMIVFAVIHMIIYEFTNHFLLFGKWNEVYCALDERLPLVQWFVLPYIYWFFFVGGALILALITGLDELKRLVKYMMVSVIPVYPIFVFYPSCMPLRPDRVEGAGFIPTLLNLLFSVDDPHNIFPSLHVVWAVGAMIALGRTKWFASKAGKLFLAVSTVMISVSTFMIKQHSVLDVIGALPFYLLGWYLAYGDLTVKE